MFDQLNELPHDQLRARLLDARDERLAIEAAALIRSPGRAAAVRALLASQLGDFMIAWRSRLKQAQGGSVFGPDLIAQDLLDREMSGQQMARGYAWLDPR